MQKTGSRASSSHGAKTDSVAAIFAGEGQYKSYANYSNASSDNRKINRRYGKGDKPVEVIEIWTRKEDFEFETEGGKECKDLHEKLLENGVPVDLKTLTRALLPPTEYGWVGPSYKSNMQPSRIPFSSNLLTKPQTWLPEEYKRLKEAEKKVREATAQLQAQERRRSAGSTSSAKHGKKAAQKKNKRPKTSL